MDDLPLELVLTVTSFLDISSSLRLFSSCKYLYSVSTNDYFWQERGYKNSLDYYYFSLKSRFIPGKERLFSILTCVVEAFIYETPDKSRDYAWNLLIHPPKINLQMTEKYICPWSEYQALVIRVCLDTFTQSNTPTRLDYFCQKWLFPSLKNGDLCLSPIETGIIINGISTRQAQVNLPVFDYLYSLTRGCCNEGDCRKSFRNKYGQALINCLFPFSSFNSRVDYEVKLAQVGIAYLHRIESDNIPSPLTTYILRRLIDNTSWNTFQLMVAIAQGVSCSCNNISLIIHEQQGHLIRDFNITPISLSVLEREYTNYITCLPSQPHLFRRDKISNTKQRLINIARKYGVMLQLPILLLGVYCAASIIT